MKSESKQELRNKIHDQEIEIEKLKREIGRRDQIEWEKHIGSALLVARKELNSTYGTANIAEVYYSRVDFSGYWFVYRLICEKTFNSLRVDHNLVPMYVQ